MKLACFSLFAFFAFSLQFTAMEIDSGFKIVTADRLDPVEKEAAKILAATLGNIFGTQLKTIAEAQWDGKESAILVGDVTHLRKFGIETAKFAQEEWYVRTLPGNILTICGGWPRGTLFGVYDFLEFAGCRYFDLNEKHIPKMNKIIVPDNFLVNKKPFFNRRFQYLGMFSPEQAAFSSWNKLNVDAVLNVSQSGLYTERQDGLCNTFYEYGKDFPKDRPEYFSLSNGVRLRPVAYYGPGQFCYSQPEARRLVKEKLLSKIKADEAMSKAKNWPPCRFYLLSINDCPTKCECPGCLALARKYGAYSGAHLDFINDVARDFPGITVVTRAYMYLIDPPKGIKAADNVKLSFAFLGMEFSTPGRDTMRPLEHPCNQKALDRLLEWKKVSGIFDIWDYQRLFSTGGCAPYVNVDTIISDSHTYAKLGIRHFFSENEYGSYKRVIELFSFQPLSVYVSAKMMEDPYRDSEALISDFMEKYYGAAAKFMRNYYDYLSKRQKSVQLPLGSIPAIQRPFLDLEFYKTAHSLMLKAEKSVVSDPVRLRRVRQEWIPLDSGLLLNWKNLKKIYREKFDFDLKQIENRLRIVSKTAIEKYFPPNYVKTMLEPDKKRIDKLVVNCMERNLPPLPDEFAEKSTLQILAADFLKTGFTLSDDPEAAGGKCLRIDRWMKYDGERKLETLHTPALYLGIQDRSHKRSLADKRLKKEEIPADEKYHFLLVGKTHLKGNIIVWAHHTWYIQIPLSSFFDSDDPEKEFELWISLKLEGPAYVKGSRRENAFSVDRLILVPIVPRK